MPATDYQRLTFTGNRSAFAVAFAARSSLWLGSDHLLCVDTNGYTETYKRFYFRDIQAITLVASRRRAVWNWILGVPTVLFLVLFLGSLSSGSPDTAQMIVYGIFLLMFGPPLLINSLRGPACTAYLRTAVQVEELPSLSRLRRARKVLDRLRPLIVAAQGEVTPEEISVRMRELAVKPDKAATAAGNPAQAPLADSSAVPPVIS